MSEKIMIAITKDEITAAVLEAVGPVCQERDALRARVAELEAAVARMAPVVRAAEGWVDNGPVRAGIGQAVQRYREAIRGASNTSGADDPELAEALDRLHRCMVHDARDWSLYRRDALSYALVVGWSDDAGWADVAARHGWSADDVSELQRFHAAIDRRKGLHRDFVGNHLETTAGSASNPRRETP